MKDIFDIPGSGEPDDPGSTSRTLLERLWANDPEGWSQMVYRYAPTIFRWCRFRFTLSEADACDTAQEVLADVVRCIHRFDVKRDDTSFRGWLYSIARIKAFDLKRSKSRLKETEGLDYLEQIPVTLEQLCEIDPHEAQELDRDIEQLVERTRAEFEPNTWQAFWQTIVEGRLVKDVAADLALTQNAIYIARSRVLGRLRATCKQLGEDFLGDQEKLASGPLCIATENLSDVNDDTTHGMPNE